MSEIFNEQASENMQMLRDVAAKEAAQREQEVQQEAKRIEEAKAAELAQAQKADTENRNQASQISEEYKALIAKASEHAWQRHGHEDEYKNLGITSEEKLLTHMISVAASPNTEYFEGSNDRLILSDKQTETRMILDINGPGTCMISPIQNNSFDRQYQGELEKAIDRSIQPTEFSPVYTVGHQGLPEINENGFDFSKIRPDIAAQEEALKQEAMKQEQAAKEAVAKQEAAFKEQVYQEALARGADEESARKSAEERAVLAQQQKEVAAAEALLTARNTLVQVEDVMRKKEDLRDAQIMQAKAEAEREKRQYQGDEPLNRFEREAKIECDASDKKFQMNLAWDAEKRKLSEEEIRRAQEWRDRQAESRREAAMREAAEQQRRWEMNEDPCYTRSRGQRM